MQHDDHPDEERYRDVIEQVNRAYVRGDPCILIVASDDNGDNTVTTYYAGVKHMIEKRGMVEYALDMVIENAS